ncbi:ENL/AF9-related [Strongyloides ratti]|uniref:ENL/AF9-related n=1 Tax=Strongyloides ratti TaxID=34506 RepID=A0A090MYZ9_STRRB|nr:ENL/AF9-related [Strongyloides ratti]CEF68064.1 ENL/AF9-related [Strongyloides ratti]
MADESPGCITKNIIAKFCIGHYSEKFKKPNEHGHTHKWLLFVRHINRSVIKDKDFISKVTYKLHPSFPDNIRIFKEPPFELSETGYGSFPLDVEIKFTGIKKVYNIKYQLELTLGEPLETFKEQNVMILDPTPQFIETILKINGMMEKKKPIMITKEFSKLNDDILKNVNSSKINNYKNTGKDERRVKKLKEKDDGELIDKKQIKIGNDIRSNLIKSSTTKKEIEINSKSPKKMFTTDDSIDKTSTKNNLKLNSLKHLINKEQNKKDGKSTKFQSISPPNIEDNKNVIKYDGQSNSRSSSRNDFKVKNKSTYISDDSRSNTPIDFDSEKRKQNSKMFSQKLFADFDKSKNKILEKIRSDPDMLKDNKKRKRKSDDTSNLTPKGSPYNDTKDVDVKRSKRENSLSYGTKKTSTFKNEKSRRYNEDTETSRSITPQEKKTFQIHDKNTKNEIPSKKKDIRYEHAFAEMISDSDSTMSSPDNLNNNCISKNASNSSGSISKSSTNPDTSLLLLLKSKIASLEDPDSIYQVTETILKVDPNLVKLVDDQFLFDLTNFPTSLINSLSKILQIIT